MRRFVLAYSTSPSKKFMVHEITKQGVRGPVHFGDARYDDFTSHADKKRRMSYFARHEKNENWTSTGMDTAGFWSRWMLWNKPSLFESIKDTERKFNIQIRFLI